MSKNYWVTRSGRVVVEEGPRASINFVDYIYGKPVNGGRGHQLLLHKLRPATPAEVTKARGAR